MAEGTMLLDSYSLAEVGGSHSISLSDSLVLGTLLPQLSL